MTRRGPRGFADLHRVPEDERIRIIGNAAARGEVVAVAIDADPEKIKRYVTKIETCFPTVMLIGRARGPGPRIVMLQFGLRSEHQPQEAQTDG